MTLNEYLKSIADAIRAKKGTSATIKPENFASEIEGITTGGGGLTDPQTFTITLDTSRVTHSNKSTSVQEGSSYENVITWASGTGVAISDNYTYIKMNGVNVSNAVCDYSDFTNRVWRISIPYVTGDIIIRANGEPI